MYKKERIDGFANLLTKKQKADWWELIACSGVQGVGKSCLLTQIIEQTSKLNNMKFSYENNLTWMRDEFITWINGKGDKKEGQMPEYSSVLVDELISLFYKRNWANSEQNDAIELMNKCRDRHLIVGGNVPNFWDLDKALRNLFTFWIHIPRRGIAWVFMPDENPFEMDRWHVKYNAKVFEKSNNPYKCKGFVAEINFLDWTPEKKTEYYDVRNKKRINTEGQGKKTNNNIKVLRGQRNELVNAIYLQRQEMKILIKQPSISKEAKEILSDVIIEGRDVSQLTGLSPTQIRDIQNPRERKH